MTSRGLTSARWGRGTADNFRKWGTVVAFGGRLSCGVGPLQAATTDMVRGTCVCSLIRNQASNILCSPIIFGNDPYSVTSFTDKNVQSLYAAAMLMHSKM